MTERVISRDPYYTLDEHFALRLEGGEVLLPCQEILPHLKVCIIDNRRINQKINDYFWKDDIPIVVTTHDGIKHQVSYAGKSGFLDLEKFSISDGVRGFMNRFLQSPSDRRDHIHSATVQEINAVGWRVYWVPLQMTGKLLHIRLVYQLTIDDHTHPTIEEAKHLAGVFH